VAAAPAPTTGSGLSALSLTEQGALNVGDVVELIKDCEGLGIGTRGTVMDKPIKSFFVFNVKVNFGQDGVKMVNAASCGAPAQAPTPRPEQLSGAPDTGELRPGEVEAYIQAWLAVYRLDTYAARLINIYKDHSLQIILGSLSSVAWTMTRWTRSLLRTRCPARMPVPSKRLYKAPLSSCARWAKTRGRQQHRESKCQE
jgi:hypothetical protein